jgi:hypothetical protein
MTQPPNQLIDRDEVRRATKWRIRELCAYIGDLTTAGSPPRSLRAEIRRVRVSDPVHDQLVEDLLSQAITRGALQMWAQRPLDGSLFAVSPPPTANTAKATLETGYLDRAHLTTAAQAYHGWSWVLKRDELEIWLADPALFHFILAGLSTPSVGQTPSAAPASTAAAAASIVSPQPVVATSSSRLGPRGILNQYKKSIAADQSIAQQPLEQRYSRVLQALGLKPRDSGCSLPIFAMLTVRDELIRAGQISSTDILTAQHEKVMRQIDPRGTKRGYSYGRFREALKRV